MAITGSLTDFSLPEIFQFIEKGNKTGLLTIKALTGYQRTLPVNHYIWVYKGGIVAAANRLDHQGLVSLIDQRQWVSERVFDRLIHWGCPITEPLGLYLKSQGALQTEQLKRLFQVQVLLQVCALFQLKDASFKFEQNVPPPKREMTGLRILATEVTLMGLRALRNWEVLAEQLPDVNSSLISTIVGQPRYRLDSQEGQVWEYSKGTVSLKAIAKHLRLPVAKVQQIAFRLISVGLVEEMPLLSDCLTVQGSDSLPQELWEQPEKPNISQSFMQNLVGFLRGKSQSHPSLSSC